MLRLSNGAVSVAVVASFPTPASLETDELDPGLGIARSNGSEGRVGVARLGLALTASDRSSCGMGGGA